MKEIKITCTGSRTVNLDDLVILQGKLKKLDSKEKAQLKSEIQLKGFSFPIEVWENEGVSYIINGTHRRVILGELREEGWVIPDIPVSDIQAVDLREAKRKILASTSDYAEITEGGLFDFMSDGDMAMEDIKDSFKFTPISLGSFEETYFNSAKKADDHEATEEEEEIEQRRVDKKKKYFRIEVLFETELDRADFQEELDWQERKYIVKRYKS